MGIRISEMEEATTFGADDYVPIVTNGTNKKALGQKIKDFIAGFFVSKSGDTMTGDLIINKRSGKIYHKTPSMTVDTSANNGLTQNSYCDFGAVDSNDYMYAWAESGASTYGFTTMALGVRNKDTDGNVINNSLTFRVNKDGTVKTTVDQPQEFRNAIGAQSTLKRKTVTVTLSSGQTGAQSTGVTRNKIISIIPIYSDDFFYDPVITTLTTNSEIAVRTTKGTAVTAQRSYAFDVIYVD